MDVLSPGRTLMLMHHPKSMTEFVKDSRTILRSGIDRVFQPTQVESRFVYGDGVGTFPDGAPRRSRLEGDANLGILRVMLIHEDDVGAVFPSFECPPLILRKVERFDGIPYSILSFLSVSTGGRDETIFYGLKRTSIHREVKTIATN